MEEDSFLTQVFIQPTIENYALDVMLTTDIDLCDCEVREKLRASDHHMIRFRVRIGDQLSENEAKVPDCNNVNFNLACELLPPEIQEQLCGTSFENA